MLIKYFDGISAREQFVQVNVIDEIVQLSDQFSNVVLRNVFIRDCTVTFINGSMFIYFEDNKRSYIVIEPDHPLYSLIKVSTQKYRTNLFDKLMQKKGISLFGVLVVLVICVYSLFIVAVPWIGLKIITVKKEITLGKQIYSSFIKDEKVDESSTVLAQEFANNLKLSSSFPIKVTVIKDSVVNAFALPGGNIIVYSGILKKINTYEEFAALLGHETTHINERHGMKSMLRNMSSSFLFALILNGVGNISGSLIKNVDQLRGLSYSRGLEEQADKAGMDVMIANKINPEGMKYLMVDLGKANSDIPDALSFMSTHPLTKERIKNADNYLDNKHHPKFSPNILLELLWKELKNQ